MKLPWRPVVVRVNDRVLTIDTSLTHYEGYILKELAIGRNVLEIGSAYGYSTVMIGQRANHVTSVDHHEHMASEKVLRRNIYEAGLESHVDVLVGNIREVGPKLREGFYTMVFVDGDHTDAGVKHDGELAKRLLKRGGIIAFHDFGEETCPEVEPAVRAVMGRGPNNLTDTVAEYWL